MTQTNNWEEELENLKCINGAMYFGSYEDPCDCGDEGCLNEATFENNLIELKSFIKNKVKLAKEEERKKKDRDNILRKFKAGEIKTVFNVGVLTVGFDFPALDCIIIARPTMSLALYIQMVGRGIRLCDGKADCAVVDMCGNLSRFCKMEDLIYTMDDVGGWIITDGSKQLSGVKLSTNYELQKL